MISDVPAFERYLRYKRGLSERTMQNVLALLRRVSQHFADGYSVDAIYAFYDSKRQEGVKNSTLNDYRKLFRHIDGFLGVDYTAEVRRLTEDPVEFDVLTPEEIEAIITLTGYHGEHKYRGDHWERAERRGKMYSVVFLLMAELALRVNEALSLTWEDWHSDTIRVQGTKTNRIDELAITPRLQAALAGLPHTDTRIFPVTRQSLDADLKRRVAFLKIPKRVSTHTFRRSWATAAVDADIHDRIIIEKMRHTSPASLTKYVQKSKKNQKKAMRLHPFTRHEVSREERMQWIIEQVRKLKDEAVGLSVEVRENEEEVVLRVQKSLY